MEAREQEVRYYHTGDSKCPFLEWFDSFYVRRAQQKFDARLARLEAGLFGDFKGVGESVQELRIDYGPGYRLYIGRDGDHVLNMLRGGDMRIQ